MFQETLRGSRGPQALDELASEKCAPRLSRSATFRKYARGAAARATFCPVARDARRVHSCREFRKADDKKVHAEKKHVDFVLVFDR